MKIIQVIPQLSEAGAEVFVVDLCNELAKKKSEVHLIVFFNNNEGDFIYKRLDSKIKVYYLEKKIGFDFSLFTKLNKLISSINPHIIHTHLQASNYIFLLSTFTKPKAKIFHTVHNDAFKETSKSLRQFQKFYFSKNNFYPITISGESHNSFNKAYPNISASKINNGRTSVSKSDQIDIVEKEIDQLKNKGEHKILLNIARITKQKNHKILIDSVKELNKENLKIKLVIIGGLRKSYSEGFEYLQDNLSENIIYLGKKDNATDYLFFADGFCLSSKYEGLPISLLEAISVGCPPVSTPAGGVPQIIKTKTYGFLAEGFEKNDLKKAITAWYKAPPEQLQEINKNLKSLYAKEYSMESCAEKYFSLFTSISQGQ